MMVCAATRRAGVNPAPTSALICTLGLVLPGTAHAIECLTPLLAQERALFDPMPTRPTEGGMFSFEDDDVVETVDSTDGSVRVHYSVAGSSVTILDDDDSDGVPDFASQVAETTAAVFDAYEALGFRRPLGEEEMGLGQLGGSYAFDVYLVDFAGQGDGAFSVDSCDSQPNVCSGFFMMENDFAGYGYSNLVEAVNTLTSHELYHAVQAAYEADSPVWYSEGTATLAERLYDHDSEDFIHLAGYYLDDTERSLDNPPTGPVPTFAYATALWWDFMNTRLGTEAIVALQESLEWDGEDKDTLTEMQAVIEAFGSDLTTEWGTFAQWNLATKFRAGAMESYEYAAEIGPIGEIAASGATIEDENRFYPLATSYYQLLHPGGELWFSHDDDATGVVFTLHPVTDGSEAGPVEPALVRWTPSDPAWFQVSEELEAGVYWLVGTQARIADSSQKFLFCLGDAAQAEVCLPEPGDSAAPDDTGDDDDGDGVCGCAATPGAPGALGMLAMVGLIARRRRRD
jgi:MYXO-CTERM domain-containing protein